MDSATTRTMFFRDFYPGDCAAQMREFLSGASTTFEPGGIFGVVVPHAGWRFSGGVAARALHALAGAGRPDCIVLFGAVHRVRLAMSVLDSRAQWATPIGAVSIDRELNGAVHGELGDLIGVDADAHDTEHSLEVELPMIRHLFPGVPIVPIMVPPREEAPQLGGQLAELLAGRNVAALASTDLTHYGAGFGCTPAGTGAAAHRWMRENDERILTLARRLEAESIVEEARSHANACGPGALAALAAFARERGAAEGEVLEHTNSFDVQGSKRLDSFHTAVGYAGMVFRA